MPFQPVVNENNRILCNAIVAEKKLSELFPNATRPLSIIQQYNESNNTFPSVYVSCRHIPSDTITAMCQRLLRMSGYPVSSDILISLFMSSLDPQTGRIKNSLIESLQETIQTLDVHIIGETLEELLRQCHQIGSSCTEGYLFCTLLYMALTGQPPVQNTSPARLSHSAVEQNMRSLLASINFTVAVPHRALELFIFRNSPLFNYLLLPYCTDSQIGLAVNNAQQALTNIPFTAWETKGRFLVAIFALLITPVRPILAHALQNASCDPRTRQLGGTFTAALQAPTFTAAIPHLYQIQQLLPEINHDNIQEIFGHTFLPLSRPCPSDPVFVKRICFNRQSPSCVTNGSILIGAHKQCIHRSNEPITTHLFAYNMQNNRLVWGTELHRDDNAASTCLASCLTTQGLVLLHQGGYLRVLNPQTGAQCYRIDLPARCDHPSSTMLHVTPAGFCYYQTMESDGPRMLYGANISERVWDERFRTEIPRGFCTPKLLGSCIEYDHLVSEGLIIEPTGIGHSCPPRQRIESAGTVYEIVASQQNHTTIRVLPSVEAVWLHPGPSFGQSWSCDAQLSLMSICNNGICICQKGSRDYVFVDIARGISRHIERATMACTTYVDRARAMLWSLGTDGHLWADSLFISQDRGVLNCDRGTHLFHVDQSNNLYLTNIQN